jgi:hypothetical protein
MTVKEQVEGLGVIDTLKRTENPLAGEWEKASEAVANSGQATSTGWTITAEKGSAGARRKTAQVWTVGGLIGFEIPVLPATSQAVEMQFGVAGENQKAGLAIIRTGTSTCTLSLFGTSIPAGTEKTGVGLAAGDSFALSWEPSGKLTAWRKTGGAWSEAFSTTGAVPESVALRAAIFFWSEGIAGTAGRVANVGAFQLTTTAPEVRAVGAIAAGTGTITPGMPAGVVLDDLLLMFIESQGSGTVPTISGWSNVFGESNLKGNTRLTVLWQVATSTAPGRTVPDTGDHQMARIIAVKAGTFDRDNPFDEGEFNTQAASKEVQVFGHTTKVDNDLIFFASAGSLPDATGTAEFSAQTNASVTSINERIDNTTAEGDGGSLMVASAILPKAGATGTMIATAATSAERANVSFSVRPARWFMTGKKAEFNEGVSSSKTYTRPTGAEKGDLLVVLVNFHTTPPPAITGFTAGWEKAVDVASSTDRQAVFWKEDDGSQSLKIEWSGSASIQAVVMSFRPRSGGKVGLDTSTNQTNASSTTLKTKGLTTGFADELLLAWVGGTVGHPVTAYPAASILTHDDAVESTHAQYVARKVVPTKETATGELNFTVSEAEATIGIQIGFKAAAGEAKTLKLEDSVAPSESRKGADQMKRTDALLSVSESRSKRPGMKRSDTQALSDLLKRAAGPQRKDIIALADAIKRTAGGKRADSVALTDKLARTLGLRKSEAATIVDVMHRRAGVARKDAFATADADNLRPGVRRKDAASPTDSLRRSGSKRIADAALLEELLIHAWIARRSLADSIPLSDDFIVKLGQELEIDEIADLSDALVSVWAAHVALDEHLSPVDSRRLSTALRRADAAAVAAVVRRAAGIHTSDSLSVSAARRLAVGKGLSEMVGVSDAIHPIEGIGIGNMVEVADAVARAWAAKLRAADSLGLLDAARVAAGKHLAEALVLTDESERAWGAVVNVADLFSLEDAIEALAAKGTNPHEHAVVKDALERMWAAVFKRADAATVSDHRSLGFRRLMREGIFVPDSHASAIAKHLGDLLALGEHVRRGIGLRRPESIAASELARRSISKSLHEMVIPQDARSNHVAEVLKAAFALVDGRRSGPGKGIRDAATAADGRNASAAARRRDTASFTDQMRRSYALSLRDHILPFDFRSRGLGLTPKDAAAFDDAVTTLHNLGVNIHEALSIAEGLRRDQVKALHELTDLEERVRPEGMAAHKAILALADLLSTKTSLEDIAALSSDTDDRAATNLSMTDGFS